MNLQTFKHSELFLREAENGIVTTKALLIYTGDSNEFDGYEITDDDLTEIFEQTNKLVQDGHRIKLFYDHGEDGKYTQKSTAGTLDVDSFELREITEADATEADSAAMKTVVGRKGIFAVVNITEESAVKAYAGKTLKEVSIGLDTQGAFGFENAIFELSAVAFPRAKAAAVFSKFETYLTNNKNKFNNLLKGNEKFSSALTLESLEKGQAVINDLYDAFYMFMEVLRNILETEEYPDGETEESLIEKLFDSHTGKLLDLLSVATNDSSNNPNPSTSSKGIKDMKRFVFGGADGSITIDAQELAAAGVSKDTENFASEFIQQIDLAKKEASPDSDRNKLAALQHEVAIGDAYTDLYSRAVVLVQKKVLPPVLFNKMFGEEKAEIKKRKEAFSKFNGDRLDAIKFGDKNISVAESLIEIYESVEVPKNTFSVNHNSFEDPTAPTNDEELDNQFKTHREGNPVRMNSL